MPRCRWQSGRHTLCNSLKWPQTLICFVSTPCGYNCNCTSHDREFMLTIYFCKDFGAHPGSQIDRRWCLLWWAVLETCSVALKKNILKGKSNRWRFLWWTVQSNHFSQTALTVGSVRPLPCRGFMPAVRVCMTLMTKTSNTPSLIKKVKNLSVSIVFVFTHLARPPRGDLPSMI